MGNSDKSNERMAPARHEPAAGVGLVSTVASGVIDTGRDALSAAANTARSGARLALGTIFAGANVLIGLGVRAARALPLRDGTSTRPQEAPTMPPEAAMPNRATPASSETITPQAESTKTSRETKHAGKSSHAAVPLVRGWWRSSGGQPVWEPHDVRRALRRVNSPLAVVVHGERTSLGVDGVCTLGAIAPTETAPNAGEQVLPLFAYAPALHPSMLGDPSFRHDYGLEYAYLAGAMANGIASVEIVEAMGRAGMMGFFGSAGLSVDRVARAIDHIQAALPNRSFGFNLIHSPSEPDLESAVVDLYLKRGVRVVDASAYLDLTLPLVRYRVSGITRDAEGRVICPNRVLGKVSRVEVARKFLSPPPEAMLNKLVASGDITPEQAVWARRVPVAQDLIVEADSGGHTDNRPSLALLPTMMALRDELQAEFEYDRPLRIGAAGGIGTPAAAAAAFAMGAAFVLTGSVNQSCVEAGTSDAVREMLAKAAQADVTMAPAADMFEMGVKVQVLKFGTMFAMRARKLYDLYRQYDSLDALPAAQRTALERDFFRCSIEQAWDQTRAFFEKRDPSQIARAEAEPKHRMALVFRSYLGQASKWANAGEPTRKADYQVWCGPAMGAFNEWARGSCLERWQNRTVVAVAMNLMLGAAVLTRVNWLRAQGVEIAPDLARFEPMELADVQGALAE